MTTLKQVWVTEDLHQRIKVHAARKKTTMQDYLDEVVPQIKVIST